MVEWAIRQWNDVKGNVKYGLLVSIPFIAGIVTRGLAWWQQLVLATLCVILVAWAIVQTIKADNLSRQREQTKDQPRDEPPDTTLKDSDPKLYIEFQDDRGVTISGKHEDEAYFVLINRSKQIARIACIETIRLKEHLISFPRFGYSLAPTDGANIYPRITTLDNRTPRSLDFFYVLFLEWDSFHNANLHELVIPVSVTYQDGSHNLFESSCELVFSISQHLRVRTGGQHGSLRVVETRNHQFKKLAIAA